MALRLVSRHNKEKPAQRSTECGLDECHSSHIKAYICLSPCYGRGFAQGSSGTNGACQFRDNFTLCPPVPGSCQTSGSEASICWLGHILGTYWSGILTCRKKRKRRKGLRRLGFRDGCGGRIWTSDLWVMSPTSYLTAPPRDVLENWSNGRLGGIRTLILK